jgi:hypothetical protein
MFQIGELFFSITPSRLCPQCNILDGRKDVSDCKQRWHYMGENHPALEQARQLDRRIDDAVRNGGKINGCDDSFHGLAIT